MQRMLPLAVTALLPSRHNCRNDTGVCHVDWFLAIPLNGLIPANTGVHFTYVVLVQGLKLNEGQEYTSLATPNVWCHH